MWSKSLSRRARILNRVLVVALLLALWLISVQLAARWLQRECPTPAANIQDSRGGLFLPTLAADIQDSRCSLFPDPGNVAIALKTGATEAPSKAKGGVASLWWWQQSIEES